VQNKFRRVSSEQLRWWEEQLHLSGNHIEKLSSNLHDKFIAAVESGFMISSYKGELYKLKKK